MKKIKKTNKDIYNELNDFQNELESMKVDYLKKQKDSILNINESENKKFFSVMGMKQFFPPKILSEQEANKFVLIDVIDTKQHKIELEYANKLLED